MSDPLAPTQYSERYAGVWRCDVLIDDPVLFARLVDALRAPPTCTDAAIYGHAGELMAHAWRVISGGCAWTIEPAGMRRAIAEIQAAKGTK